jgi:hypothetical protein
MYNPDPIPHKITPYNTGKVSIGIHYHPKVTYPISRDMERLQGSLLEHPAAKRARAATALLIILAFGAMVGLAIAWMI